MLIMAIKNGLDKIYYGIAYYGKELEGMNLSDIPGYSRWRAMLQRCYDKKIHNRQPTYIDCSVCEEWCSLYNFNKWYLKNYYSIDGERMELDKDILVKGNKMYSPDTYVCHSALCLMPISEN